MRKVMLITGGSRGIGAATARLAAARGYDVMISFRERADEADAVLAAARAGGARAEAAQADMAEPEAVAGLFAALDRAFGRLDVLVNNAGIVAKKARLDEMPLERLQRLYAVNILGATLALQAAVRRMSTRHGGAGGAIVNLSSRASTLGSPGEYVDYAASKGAIDSLTIGLAKEVAGEGIRVNAVRPGLIHTDIHALSGVPNRVESLKHTIPMGRGGTAEEVAEAVLWLASDAASYVTGALLDINGGR